MKNKCTKSSYVQTCSSQTTYAPENLTTFFTVFFILPIQVPGSLPRPGLPSLAPLAPELDILQYPSIEDWLTAFQSIENWLKKL
jgi:hypothetical protein